MSEHLTTLDQLSSRVSKLERELFVWRCLAGGMVSLLVVFGVWLARRTDSRPGPAAATSPLPGQVQPLVPAKTIDVELIRLRGPDGAIRGLSGVMERGPVMILYDQNGKTAASLSATDDFHGLAVVERKHQGMIDVGSGPRGGLGMSFSDSNYKTRLWLATATTWPT